VNEFSAADPVDLEGVQYTYGAFSNREKAIQQPAGTVLVNTIADRLGRPEHQTDLGAGERNVVYTPFGEVDTITDGLYETTFKYDNLGRQTERMVEFRTEDREPVLSKWVWRAGIPGQLDYATAEGVTTTFGYDVVGRVDTMSREVDGETFSTSVTDWDDEGRPRVIKYPGAVDFRVEHVYDQNSGVLSEVRSVPAEGEEPTLYWKLGKVSAFGQVEEESIGGIGIVKTHHPFTGFPKTVVATNDQGNVLQDDLLTFDDAGNLESSKALGQAMQTYEYDRFARLDSVTVENDVVADPAYTEYYGSILQSVSGLTYSYDDSNPHSVKTITDSDENVSEFEYDVNGRLLHRSAGALGELNAEYSPIGKPSKIWGEDAALGNEYIYDSDGVKVVRKGPLATTIYFDDLYYVERDQLTGAETHHYVIGNGEQAVAEVKRISDGDPSLDEVETLFILTDHLGSPAVLVDQSGGEVERVTFSPYGELPASSGSSQRGYTGHWTEIERGIIDMRGRFYDAATGQFLSPDPFVGSALSSQSFNRKAYVLNNPLRFTDPSGFQPCDELSTCGTGGGSFTPTGPAGNNFLGGEGNAGIGNFAENLPGYSGESKAFSSGATSSGTAATAGEKAVYLGAGVGVGVGTGYVIGKGAAIVCAVTGVCTAAVVAVVVVSGTGYLVYDLFLDGGGEEIASSFTNFRTKEDAFRVGTTLGVVGSVAARPVASRIASRLPGSWPSVRAQLGADLDLPAGTPVHHWLIPQGGREGGRLTARGILDLQWGRAFPNAIKNGRWNLMTPPAEVLGDPWLMTQWHAALHGGGRIPLSFAGRLWYGSPTWAKVVVITIPGAAGVTTYYMEVDE
jgi:RHS repeat-associated protein